LLGWRDGRGPGADGATEVDPAAAAARTGALCGRHPGGVRGGHPAGGRGAGVMTGPTAVYLEVGARKVFAAAVDWPGWGRAGRTEEPALAALEEYAERSSEVPAQVGVPFPKSLGTAFEVVERLPGNSTTDFGAPSRLAVGDGAPLTAAAATRIAGLVGGCWEVF